MKFYKLEVYLGINALHDNQKTLTIIDDHSNFYPIFKKQSDQKISQV